MKRNHPIRLLIGWLILLLTLSLILIVPAFYLTEAAFPLLYKIPRFLLRWIVPAVWLLALFTLLRVAAITIHHLIPHQHPQKPTPMEEAMAALDRIAAGDFKVFLEVDERQYYSGLAEKINELAKGLDSTERMRQDFVSNVSHEIQSPLTSIGGFATLLKQEDLDPETRNHYLEIIEAETTRLSKLSENLLRLSALDAESRPLKPQEFRLDRQIESVLLLLEPQWSEKQLELEVDMDRVSITGDEDLLSQVWINLIHNSIKFTPEGGRLSISLKQVGEKCQFVLEDTGIGMPPEAVNRIFERFYKADSARMRSAGGNGLGLSIVKKIVRLHQGEIKVESVENQGSTFTVILPKA